MNATSSRHQVFNVIDSLEPLETTAVLAGRELKPNSGAVAVQALPFLRTCRKAEAFYDSANGRLVVDADSEKFSVGEKLAAVSIAGAQGDYVYALKVTRIGQPFERRGQARQYIYVTPLMANAIAIYRYDAQEWETAAQPRRWTAK